MWPSFLTDWIRVYTSNYHHQEEQLGVSLLTREQLLSREVQQRLQGKLTRLLPLPAPFGFSDSTGEVASERAIVCLPEMHSEAEEQLEDEEAVAPGADREAKGLGGGTIKA